MLVQGLVLHKRSHGITVVSFVYDKTSPVTYNVLQNKL